MKWTVTNINKALSKFTVLDQQTGKSTSYFIAGIDTVELIGDVAIVRKTGGRAMQIDLLDGMRKLKSR